MMKFIAVSFALMFAMNISAAKKSKVTPLQFDPDCGTKASLTMTDGRVGVKLAILRHRMPADGLWLKVMYLSFLAAVAVIPL